MKHFDLGRHTRHIATRSTEAQRWFDLGLNWQFEPALACRAAGQALVTAES
jgi:hypothetical protein